MASMGRNLLSASAIALCAASAAAADVQVEFWHSFGGGGGKALDTIIADFEAANPGIDIVTEHVGNYNDIVAKLQAAIPANRAPDAVILEVTRYGLFADSGVLLDLTPYLDADPLKADLFDFAREVGVYEGKNYIVPFNNSTPVMYYNREIMERAGFAEEPAPKTYDDLLAVSKTVTEKLGGEGIYGIAAPGQFARWGLIMSNDSDLIDSVSGEILIDAPNTIDAYKWMSSLVHEHKVASPDGVTDEDLGKDAFTAGKVAINLGSTGSYGGYVKALGDKLEVRPMPCNKVCRVPIGGAGIGILASAEKEVQEAAYKFVSFAASAESNAKWFAATGYMPINRKTAEQPVAAEALATQPGIRVAIDQLPVAKGRPRPPVVTWMRSTGYDMWQAMALGQRPVEETLTDFAARTREEAKRSQ
ncbi:MAG: ABC transporter substrate-binding protein [Rhodobacteraceae bacterium]|nr:ABC transporter substrate-binding protein [Paracoccaceae bacterium]